MTFTYTRVVLPGIGAICVECRTEAQLALTPVRMTAATNGRITEPRVSQSENASMTPGIEDPTPAAKCPGGIPPHSISEPGMVIQIMAEYPAQSARWRASDVERPNVYQLTLRVEKRAPVDLKVSHVAPEPVEQLVQEERGANFSPGPSTVPVPIAEPEVATNSQASAAVLRPLERPPDQDTSASLPLPPWI
jgi:hypothetical protein